MAKKQIHLLLVEDNPGDIRLIEEYLRENASISYVVEKAHRLTRALKRLSEGGIDIVLLDLDLPDSRGMATLTEMLLKSPSYPIVILTGVYQADSIGAQAVYRGAQDYLIKGEVNGRILSRVILYAIERHRQEETLRTLSLRDDLTGLYNHRGFSTLAEEHIHFAHRTRKDFAIVLVDMDGLKQINDTYGHPQGDKALLLLAETMKKIFRVSDVVARTGGDEFSIFIKETTLHGVEILLKRFCDMLDEHNTSGLYPYPVSVSLGMVHCHPGPHFSLKNAIAQADKALYEQKQSKQFFFEKRISRNRRGIPSSL